MMLQGREAAWHGGPVLPPLNPGSPPSPCALTFPQPGLCDWDDISEGTLPPSEAANKKVRHSTSGGALNTITSSSAGGGFILQDGFALPPLPENFSGLSKMQQVTASSHEQGD